MRWVGRLLAGLILAVAVALWLAPQEPDDLSAHFDEALLAGGVDEYLADQEARIPDLREGSEKRVIWAGAPEDRTDWAVVYLHGFSAGPEEIRPVPDRVAEALGANLYFARLTGHGRDGAAMGEATLPHWMGDVAEAMAIGRRIGERVLVLGTSTGGTLATLAAIDPDLSENIAGLVLISPNYRVKSASTMILTWPGVRYWGPLLAGEERRFSPQNAGHAAHWTTAYPTIALLPMAETVKAARAVPHDQIDTPALFVFSDLDQVVDAGVTRQVASAWGGPAEIMSVDPARTEPAAHVIAGDILSAEMTGPVAARIVDWARAIPVAPVSD